MEEKRSAEVRWSEEEADVIVRNVRLGKEDVRM